MGILLLVLLVAAGIMFHRHIVDPQREAQLKMIKCLEKDRRDNPQILKPKPDE